MFDLFADFECDSFNLQPSVPAAVAEEDVAVDAIVPRGHVSANIKHSIQDPSLVTLKSKSQSGWRLLRKGWARGGTGGQAYTQIEGSLFKLYTCPPPSPRLTQTLLRSPYA